MVIRFRSSAIVLKLITVRGILQQVRGGSRSFWKGGFARPIRFPGLWDGLVNQAFGYSSFLKDGDSFITYIRCTIKEKRWKSSLLCKHGDYSEESPHCFVVQGRFNPPNPPWIRLWFVIIKWRNWVLVTSEHTFETIALLFWLDFKG